MVRWRLSRLLTKKRAARALLVLGLAVVAAGSLAAVAWAAQPRPWQMGMQPPATPVKDRLNAFHNELLVIIFLISGVRHGAAALCDRSLQPPAQPGALAHLAQYRDRDAVDDHPGADPGHDRDPVIQADVLYGSGPEPGHDDQGDRASMVLVLRVSRPEGIGLRQQHHSASRSEAGPTAVARCQQPARRADRTQTSASW